MTYIENSFKGLDITIGNGGPGGILIRSVLDSSGTPIEGPSKVVDHILALTGRAKITDLIPHLGELKVDDPTSPLRLMIGESKDVPSPPIFASPRVGLSLKQDVDRRLPYLMQPYRFCSVLAYIKKNKVTLMLSLYHVYKIKDLTLLAQVSGVKPGQIQKYLQACVVCDIRTMTEFSTVEQQAGAFAWHYQSTLT